MPWCNDDDVFTASAAARAAAADVVECCLLFVRCVDREFSVEKEKRPVGIPRVLSAD